MGLEAPNVGHAAWSVGLAETTASPTFDRASPTLATGESYVESRESCFGTQVDCAARIACSLGVEYSCQWDKCWSTCNTVFRCQSSHPTRVVGNWVSNFVGDGNSRA